MNTSKGVSRHDWRLLDTDYDNWMVKYSCMDMMWDGMHWETWSINAKGGHTLSAEDYATAEAVLYDKVPNMDINWLTKHNSIHYGCTYNWDMQV
jgi:tRNA splicing ligase